MSSICFPPGANDQPVNVCLTILIPGNFFFACMKPRWRSVSAGTPAMPRISTTLPLPPSFLNNHVAPSAPYATWSFVTFQAPGADTRWSIETTLIPRAAACWITGLSAVALEGLMMIAFAPAEIRLRMSALCSAGPPFLFATITLLTTPLAFACALTAQIISSRQPLPTSVFETPITYVASLLPDFASAMTRSAQRRPMGRNFIQSPPRELVVSTGGNSTCSLRGSPLSRTCRSSPSASEDLRYAARVLRVRVVEELLGRLAADDRRARQDRRHRAAGDEQGCRPRLDLVHERHRCERGSRSDRRAEAVDPDHRVAGGRCEIEDDIRVVEQSSRPV